MLSTERFKEMDIARNSKLAGYDYQSHLLVVHPNEGSSN